MGCGSGGSYLYRLLRQKKPNLEVRLFDVQHATACGIKGCGWGVSWPRFVSLCHEVAMDPEEYVLMRYDHILIDHLRVGANVAMVDKPRLIKNMLAGVRPLNPSEAALDTCERIIDATGVDRAYLSPRIGLAAVDAVQIRITTESLPCPMVFTHGDGGYTWLFPLGDGEAHLGIVSPQGMNIAAESVNTAKRAMEIGQVLCSCTGRIWRSGPVLPFTEGKTWGLGEAIGLIDPISGAGIVPAMTSAKIMVSNWENAKDYERQAWDEYSYMVSEARIVTRLAARKRPAYRDMFLPRRAFDNIGINPDFRQLVRGIIRARKRPKNS